MVENQIHYDDGAAYERYIGNWSRLAGEMFLDWLAPLPHLRWIDIGGGTGAARAAGHIADRDRANLRRDRLNGWLCR